MIVRFGVEARTTRDIDALTDLEFDEMFELVEDHLDQGWEGFTGTIVRRKEIIEANVVPLPQRCEIKLSYMKKNFVTLIFEIGKTSKEVMDESEFVVNSVDLDPVCLGEERKIPLLNTHYQVAQKLHACTETLAEIPNRRVHDLLDICMLEFLIRREGLEQTRKACIKTFSERDTHDWPPVLPNHSDWQSLWDAIEVSETFRVDYKKARRRVSELIEDIDNTC